MELTEDGHFMEERLDTGSIVAIEECPDDVVPTTAMGWDPRTGVPG